MEKTRRRFCGDVCKAALLGGAFGAQPGCGGGGGGGSTGPSGSSAPALGRITGSLAGNTVTFMIDAGSPLAATGSLALVQAGSTSLLVARTGATSFNAMTATCTHEACVITGGTEGRFVCPCHGSTFDSGGRVVNGPAVTSLRTFATSFASNTVTITL